MVGGRSDASHRRRSSRRAIVPSDLTGADAEFVEAVVKNQGFERVGIGALLAGSTARLPFLDWPLLAAFAAIAGAGMLSNALFSNYARDKGWGMGAKTGAIPSADRRAARFR